MSKKNWRSRLGSFTQQTENPRLHGQLGDTTSNVSKLTIGDVTTQNFMAGIASIVLR